MSPGRSHVKEEHSVRDLQPGGSSAVCERLPKKTTWRTILSLPGVLCVAKICGQKCALLRRISCGFPTGPHVHWTVHHLLCCQPIPQCDNSCICTLLDCISRVGQQVLKKTAHWDFSWAHVKHFHEPEKKKTTQFFVFSIFYVIIKNFKKQGHKPALWSHTLIQAYSLKLDNTLALQHNQWQTQVVRWKIIIRAPACLNL